MYFDDLLRVACHLVLSVDIGFQLMNQVLPKRGIYNLILHMDLAPHATVGNIESK